MRPFHLHHLHGHIRRWWCLGSLYYFMILFVSSWLVIVVEGSQAAGQETLLGIVGKDFILFGADSSLSQGVSLTTSNVDKIIPLVNPYSSTGSSSSSSTTTTTTKATTFNGFGSKSHRQYQQSHRQQCIVAAVAGDPAMSDRLIGLLQAQATIREYEGGVGSDVHFISVPSLSSSADPYNEQDEEDNEDGLNTPPPPPRTTMMSLNDDEALVEEGGLNVEGMAYLARSHLSSIRPNANVCLLIGGMMMKTTTKEEEDDIESQSSSSSTSTSSSSSFVSQRVQQQTQQAWKKNENKKNDDIHPFGINKRSKEKEEENLEAKMTTPTSTEEPSSSWSSSEVSSSEESSSSSTTPQQSSTTLSLLRPCLYWLDELGSLQEILYGVHGLGSNFCWSILDHGYKVDMTLEEAIHLMTDCFQQLRTRYLINSPQQPCMKVIDANGIRFIQQQLE